MAYTIYHADGTQVTVPDNAIDIAFYNANAHSAGVGIGTQLVGRNAINYGAAVAQNFLQMTENFASTSLYRPTDAYALQGQLWFDKTSSTAGTLCVRVSSATTGGDANWEKVVTANYTTGNVVVSGSVTATEFIGGGAGLTNIPVTAITGASNWSIVNPTGTPKAGDIKVDVSVPTAPKVWIYTIPSATIPDGWAPVFPAVYS